MASFTHFARPLGFREYKLVDDDVVRVDAALGQLLDQPLRLIQGEELSDTHTDKGGLFLMDVRESGEDRRVTTHLQKAFNMTGLRVELFYLKYYYKQSINLKSTLEHTV